MHCSSFPQNIFLQVSTLLAVHFGSRGTAPQKERSWGTRICLNLISHLQDKHKKLLTWGAFSWVSKWEGLDCLGQLIPWTAIFKLTAHRYFHRGREHLFECHKALQPGPAVHSEPSLKCLHPNHTCTYFSKNRRKLSTRSLLTLVTQIQKYLQSS